MLININNLNDLTNFASKFTKILNNPSLIFLSGDLGAGKTTFVKYVLAKLGCKDHVTSPTFSLINIYELKQHSIYHCDFYRIKSDLELINLNLDEFIEKNIVFIEWPEIINNHNNYKYIKLDFQIKKRESRIINISGTDKCTMLEINKIFQKN